MDTLPIEIITHIMKFLRKRDKHRASLVCKKWYKASIDPSIHRNVVFRLRCDVDVEPPANEVLEGIGRRNIRNLRIYFISDKVYSEVRNWSGYKSITSNITTIEMTQFTTTSAGVFFDILTNCPNIQTVDMYVYELFKFLKQDTMRDKIIGVLTDLSHLILKVNSSKVGPEHIEYLMTLLKVVEQLKISRADLRKNRSSQGLAVSLPGINSSQIPISTLRMFCEKYGCPLSIGILDCSENEIRLARFLDVLRCIPKLKVRSLYITLYSVSEVNELNQISDVNVHSLNLRLSFTSGGWFTQNSLSSIVSASPLFSHLSFELFMTQCAVDSILKSLPNVYAVIVGQSNFSKYPCRRKHMLLDQLWDKPCNRWQQLVLHWPNITPTQCGIRNTWEPTPVWEPPERSPYVNALFKTASDGKPKLIEMLENNYWQFAIVRTSVLFCAVHPNLQIFVLKDIFTFEDSNFVLRLISCFPGLTAVCLEFEKAGAKYFTEKDLPNQVDLSPFSRLKGLQTLWLRINVYLAKIKMNGLQFPKLKELDLSGCVNLTNECLREIGRSMPSLESLNISDCLRIGDVGLQSVLKSLTHLRELSVAGCKQVNATTLKMISNCASLKILWVSKGNHEFTAAIKEIRESSSNLTIEYERIREMKW